VSNFGNPLLEPERTIQYEIGYEQNLFDKMSLRLTGYYKDINNEIADVEIFPLGYGGSDYNTYLNMAFRDVRGLEAFLEMRRNVLPYVSGWISFNYLVESGAEYGYDRFYENPSDQARLAQTEVSKPDVRPLVKVNFNFSTPDDFYGPMLGETSLLGGFSIDLLYTWQRGEAFTWNPANYPLVEDNVRWNPYQRFDLRLNKTLFRRGTLESVFYIDVTNLFNNRNMTAFDLDFDDEEVNNVDQGWAWNSHRWWNNQDRDYLYSLGYTPENQNRDGSFNNTIGDPGDWDDDAINLPGFSPFTFLGKRDVFFGIKFYF
jgi:outer membrane receptor protein involved in Fe transport